MENKTMKNISEKPIHHKCNECGEEKPFTKEFYYIDKNRKFGLTTKCRICIKAISHDAKRKANKKYWEKNKETLIEKNHQNLLKVKDTKEYKEKRKKWAVENKENIKEYKREYYKQNKDFLDKKNKEYREQNKEELLQKAYDRYNERYNNEPLFRMKVNIRTRVRYGINNKTKSTLEILGCGSWEKFYQYIESQFVEGMSWDNPEEWHYDHYYPISLAETEEDMYIFNHYTNFQPLWAKDNLSKSNKVPDGFEEWYEMMKEKVSQ